MQVYVLLLPHKCMIIHLHKLQSPFTVEYYKEEVVKAEVQIHGHMIPMFCPLQDAVLLGVGELPLNLRQLNLKCDLCKMIIHDN
jgi:hypothetical protein